jgi:hypothetical protein
MRRALWYLIPLLLAGALVGGYFAFSPKPPEPQPQSPPEQKPGPESPPPSEPPPQDATPKLVVLMVFDQMRGDYLARWAEVFGPGGFERMKKGGIWFSECRVPYLCTLTAPGHASLSTGAPPSVHGIVGNEWYDRKSHAEVYCCQPNRVYELVPPVPEANRGKLTRGSASGFSPEKLLAPTVADSLNGATEGKARVFALSVKDRTAVVMGGQKPTGAYCFDTRDGKFHTSAFYGRDAAHPWVTELNNSKLADSWFDRKWERLRTDLDYAKFSGPDDVAAEAPGLNGQGRTFPHPYKGKLGAPAKPYYDALEASPAGNELLLELAKKCVAAEKLGRSEVPDLLCVSFSSNDLVGHLYGPDSQEVLDMTLRADRLVSDFLRFLDSEVGRDRYAVVLSADHGSCPMPELAGTKAKYPAAQRVAPAELEKGLEAALTGIYGAEPAGPTKWVEYFDENVCPWVYLNHQAIEARKLKAEDVAVAARDWLAGRGFMETAFTRQELEGGSAKDKPFGTAAILAYRRDRSGDAVAIPKAGVLVTRYKTGTTHGSPWPYDAHVPFLVYGAGVPALGKRPEKVSSLCVAPTLAWALGVPAPEKAALPRPEAIPTKK